MVLYYMWKLAVAETSMMGSNGVKPTEMGTGIWPGFTALWVTFNLLKFSDHF